MKKFLLFLLLGVFALEQASSQTLYSNSNSAGNVFNPGLSTAGNPKVVFDDVNIPSLQVGGGDSVIITKVKFGIYRFANAPAATVSFYYTPINPAATTFNNILKVPPVLIGTANLAANGSLAGNTIVNFGDSLNALFKVKTDTGFVYRNYQTLFLGVGFSSASTNTSWRFATPNQSFNDDVMWIYNPDSTTQQYASFFGGTPAATFYIQVFGRPNTPLPIVLKNFSGERNGKINILNWTTASETNNKGFELQRSADGINFSTLGFIASKAANGSSSAALTYSYKDEKALPGNGYYRLNQIDKDGKSTASNIVLIKGLPVSTLTVNTIYPNPVKNSMNVVIATPSETNVTLTIADFSGKILSSQTKQAVSGENRFQLNTAALTAGNYLLKVTNSKGETTTQRFTKQ